MIEIPSKGRAKIYKNGNRIEVQIAAKKNWFTIVFLCVWMGGWTFGESFALIQLFSSESPIFVDAFLLVWLTGWTIGGFFVVTVLLWSFVGFELIKVEAGVIEIGKQIFNFKRSKKYQISEIRYFSINPISGNEVWGMGYQQGFFGKKNGVLKFDYGLKTIKFGEGIDEAEGRILIDSFKTNSNFKEENF